jgi:hypothetical protein
MHGAGRINGWLYAVYVFCPHPKMFSGLTKISFRSDKTGLEISTDCGKGLCKISHPKLLLHLRGNAQV